jgi:hypothetical protein
MLQKCRIANDDPTNCINAVQFSVVPELSEEFADDITCTTSATGQKPTMVFALWEAPDLNSCRAGFMASNTQRPWHLLSWSGAN